MQDDYQSLEPPDAEHRPPLRVHAVGHGLSRPDRHLRRHQAAEPIIVASKTDQVDLAAQPAAPIAYGYLKDLIQTSSQAGLPYSITKPDNRQIAPRFGFAWRPFGETTVVRGGYGIFYEGEYTDGRVNLFMPPFLLQDSALNDRGVIPNRTLANFYLGAPLGSPNSTIGLTPEYTHMRMGYDQHWNFGVQQQLAEDHGGRCRVCRQQGLEHSGQRRLQHSRCRAAGGVQARRQFPRFGAFSYISSDISSTYHALQAKFEKRLSRGLWLLVRTPFRRASGSPTLPRSAALSPIEKGPSEYHVPHSFSSSFGYELPFGKGKPLFGNANRLTNGVLGGWQLQGILVFRSGVPFTRDDVARRRQYRRRRAAPESGSPRASSTIRRSLSGSTRLLSLPRRTSPTATPACASSRRTSCAPSTSRCSSSSRSTSARGCNFAAKYSICRTLPVSRRRTPPWTPPPWAASPHHHRAAANAGSTEAYLLT